MVDSKTGGKAGGKQRTKVDTSGLTGTGLKNAELLKKALD